MGGDLMCPARLVCMRYGGTDGIGAALRGWGVCRAYVGPGVAATLDVPVEIVDGLAEARGGTAAVRNWLLDGDLSAGYGETGAAVLARFAAALDGIAARHRGETVAVVSYLGTLSLGLAALCRGLSPRRLWEQPPEPGRPIPIEYDGEIWRAL